jgi:hypothetical protein
MMRSMRVLALIAAAAVLLPSLGLCVEEQRKSPFLAVVASAALPGGGQFYCENYVRGAVFCCAQTALTAMTLYEHVLTEEALRRYRASGDEEDYDEYSRRFDRRNDLLWWDAGILLLSAADAFVDAHMHGFGKKGAVKVGLLENEGVGLHVRLCF